MPPPGARFINVCPPAGARFINACLFYQSFVTTNCEAKIKIKRLSPTLVWKRARAMGIPVNRQSALAMRFLNNNRSYIRYLE